MEHSIIQLFEQKKIRTLRDEEHEKWWFSVIDIIGILTESPNSRKYRSVLKTRLKQEWSEVATNCSQLKMIASDGKFYFTDVMDTEQIFRLIQSIPSPKAEPFKLWIAKVAKNRVDQIQDPELSIKQAMMDYKNLWYEDNRINQRLKSIEIRKELTDERRARGVQEGQEFALLTDIITFNRAGINTREYKKFKNLKKENLRDNMTNLELALNTLAEATTTELSKKKQPKTFVENGEVARDWGKVAGNARKEIEEKLWEKIISPLNAKSMKQLWTKGNL